jgi:Arc/MetJ family transcription regulator
MITQINVDENLLNQVITLGQCASKEEAVVLALQEFIRHRKQQEIIKLFGTLDPDDEQAHFRKKRVVLGVMEGAFSVPDDFDRALPESVENAFYAENL